MGAFTYSEWEAMWLLTMGQVEFNDSTASRALPSASQNVRDQDLVAMAGGENISRFFHRLKNRGYITIHRPGWLNGKASGWRIEITNDGWKAMDKRPVREGARHGVHEGDADDG